MTISIPSSSASSSSSSSFRDINSVHASDVIPRRWGALESFSRRMGFHRRSSVRPTDPQRRILPSVSSSSTSGSSATFTIHGSLEAGSDQGRRRGGGGFARQRCHPSSFQDVARFGVKDLRRHEERWRVEADYQPQIVENKEGWNMHFSL